MDPDQCGSSSHEGQPRDLLDAYEGFELLSTPGSQTIYSDADNLLGWLNE